MTAPTGAGPYCPDPVDLTAFADGELDGRARSALQAHVDGCARCRADLDAERRAKHAVGSLTTPSPSPQLVERLLALGEGPATTAAPGPMTVGARAAAQFTGACLAPEIVTAFADGELGHQDREVVQAHVTRCARCLAEVEAERRTRRAVRALPDVPPSPELVTRLHDIPATAGSAGPVDELQAARASREEAKRARRTPRPVALLTGAASVAVFFVGAAAFLGTTGEAPAPVRPAGAAVVPAADRFAAEHAATSIGGGFGESALATVSTAALTAPTAVNPAGLAPSGADVP